MTYAETCDRFAKLAADKAWSAKNRPLGFLVGSMLAGAYIGVALVLAYTCANGLPAGVRPLVTGSVFGIGLLLVMFAGADMFTGYVMYVTFGLARRTITAIDAVRLFVYVWVANLVGAAIFSAIFTGSGGGVLMAAPATYFHAIITAKETSAFVPLLCRAILCNWLVCLAIWTPARLKDETAKIWAMAWCLLAFVACGFDHSVANMSAVLIGLFQPVPIGTLSGAVYDLAVVSLGNLLGGAIFVTGAYLLVTKTEHKTTADYISDRPA